MVEQRGVCAFEREGRACDPLLDLAHLGWITAASDTVVQRSVVRRQRLMMWHG
jgi:hypothetical protein